VAENVSDIKHTVIYGVYIRFWPILQTYAGIRPTLDLVLHGLNQNLKSCLGQQMVEEDGYAGSEKEDGYAGSESEKRTARQAVKKRTAMQAVKKRTATQAVKAKRGRLRRQ